MSLIDDEDVLLSNDIGYVKYFIKNTYDLKDRYGWSWDPVSYDTALVFTTNKTGIIEVSTARKNLCIQVKPELKDTIEHLTDNSFIFSNIYEFDCSGCSKLKDLSGAPKYTKMLRCMDCIGLESLNGIGTVGTLRADGCVNLKYISSAYYKIQSLIGLPLNYLPRHTIQSAMYHFGDKLIGRNKLTKSGNYKA